MRRDVGLSHLSVGGSLSNQQSASITVLAVGDLEGWLRRGRSLPTEGKVAFVEFADVTEDLFETLAPSVVLSPLLARGFDCIDLAQVLCRLGFRGRYRAMADRLPDPALIQKEISALCPNLDFGVLTLREQPRYLAS